MNLFDVESSLNLRAFMLFETCFLWYVMHLMLASFAFFFYKKFDGISFGGFGKTLHVDYWCISSVKTTFQDSHVMLFFSNMKKASLPICK